MILDIDDDIEKDDNSFQSKIHKLFFDHFNVQELKDFNLHVFSFDMDDNTVKVSSGENGETIWIPIDFLQKVSNKIKNLNTKIEMLEAINKQGSFGIDGRRKL